MLCKHVGIFAPDYGPHPIAQPNLLHMMPQSCKHTFDNNKEFGTPTCVLIRMCAYRSICGNTQTCKSTFVIVGSAHNVRAPCASTLGYGNELFIYVNKGSGEVIAYTATRIHPTG